MSCLYCDEDVDILLKSLLGAKGFPVHTALDENMLGQMDQRQFEHAIRLGCVMVTHNRIDFERLYSGLAAEGVSHSGLIIATRRSVYDLARRIARVLSQHTKETMANRILYV